MIFDFSILGKKPIINIDDENIVDLLHQSIDYSKSVNISNPLVLVSKELAGKPGVIAKILYEDENTIDLLCCFNEISNPLTIDFGDVLIAPDENDMKNCLVDAKIDSNVNNSNKALFISKLNKVDIARINKLKQDSKSTLSSTDIRTPNMVKDGTQQTTAQNGEIILGTNISDTRCSVGLSDTQQLTEKIRKAIKEKVIATKLPTVAMNSINRLENATTAVKFSAVKLEVNPNQG